VQVLRDETDEERWAEYKERRKDVENTVIK
jgi:hypothetical protein